METTTKEWQLAIHGDLLEKNSADFITSQLPGYGKNWSTFIGHDQKGKMASMIGSTVETEKIRADFAEHHYTVLESLYLMKHVQKLEELREIKTFDEYLRVLNSLMAFQSHAGRIRDNILSCFDILGLSEESNKARLQLEEFYQVRHVFVHGKKVPFSINADNLFQIARPKRSSTDEGIVGKNYLWEDVQITDLKAIDEQMEETVSQLTALLNILFEQLFGHVKEYMKNNNLVLSTPEQLTVNTETVTPLSASTMNFQSSGSVYFN